MTAFDYARLRDNTALPLLTRFGQDCTLTTRTSGAYDPATLTNTKTETTITGIGALFDFTDADKSFTLIEQNDRKAILDATNFTTKPRIGDQLDIGGESLVVREVHPVSPGNVPVIWILRVSI